MTQYATKKIGTNEVSGFADGEGDEPPVVEGAEVEALAAPAAGFPVAPFDGAVLIISDGLLEWRDDRAIENARLAAIDAIDAASDLARAAILVKNTNTIEYQVALADAIKYRDAGFAGPVPRGVSSWSHAKRRQGWTDQQAAEDILATEARWMNALYFIREQRLDAKEMVRDAVTNAEVDALLATFTATLTAAMQGV